MKNMHPDENFGCFRNYNNSTYQERVKNTYKAMHVNQSQTYVTEKKQHYSALKLGKMSVFQVFRLLENIHDQSDPDNDLPQIEHAYQTAEAIQNNYMAGTTNILESISLRSLFRKKVWDGLPGDKQTLYARHNLKSFYPEIIDWSWFPLVGFIHDLGKIMLLKAFGSLPQWSVVGDTYPVGCPFSPANIFYTQYFYRRSADHQKFNHQTSTTFGKYTKQCGFDAVDMSWGHDEYIYLVMKQGSLLCDEGLYILRYHSFYPWHTPQYGVQGYRELASEKDWNYLPLLKAFQKADLYSKLPELPPRSLLENKYRTLLQQYAPRSTIDW